MYVLPIIMLPDFSYVMIPWAVTSPLETLSFQENQDTRAGDCMPHILQHALRLDDVSDVRIVPLKRTALQCSSTATGCEDAGLYAYVTSDQSIQSCPNIRATCLAMACGLHSRRFYGDVYVSMLGYGKSSSSNNRIMMNLSMQKEDVESVCETPDLRNSIIRDIRCTSVYDHSTNNSSPSIILPCLLDAAKQNYHDAAMIQRLDAVMQSSTHSSKDSRLYDKRKDTDEFMQAENEDQNQFDVISLESSPPVSPTSDIETSMKQLIDKSKTVQVTLCLHCRRSSNTLCTLCQAVYFCDAPRTCREDCWSHRCVCATWKIYNQRRSLLEEFPFHPENWYIPLLDRSFQLSEQPYKLYLINELGVVSHSPGFQDTISGDIHSSFSLEQPLDLSIPKTTLYDLQIDESTQRAIPINPPVHPSTFWTTEVDGWIGGLSGSARLVDPSFRHSYKSGFGIDTSNRCSKLKVEWIPPERRLFDEEIQLWMMDPAFKRKIIHVYNECPWIELNNWRDYYDLRGIPCASPVALLCSFPITIYYAIQQYGLVHLNVSVLMKRALRIHIVGAEKEINFLDLFKEIAYIVPTLVKLELVFIIRTDMLPPNCSAQDDRGRQRFYTEMKLTENLTVFVTSGTYGNSIDPIWDCGTGSPDIVMGLNAGLFAYESWRDVVDFLNHNRNVTGVFTDYNEHSGLNCASLGGLISRESLSINPFRQPRAMPVLSMNLPQISNGFMYVFNAQPIVSEW